MLTDPARENSVLFRPISRSDHGEAVTIEQVFTTNPVEQRRSRLAEITFQAFRIRWVTSTDCPQPTPLPPLHDKGKRSAPF
jgi:hypothetical protein